jgi:hypothetical protein
LGPQCASPEWFPDIFPNVSKGFPTWSRKDGHRRGSYIGGTLMGAPTVFHQGDPRNGFP